MVESKEGQEFRAMLYGNTDGQVIMLALFIGVAFDTATATPVSERGEGAAPLDLFYYYNTSCREHVSVVCL